MQTVARQRLILLSLILGALGGGLWFIGEILQYPHINVMNAIGAIVVFLAACLALWANR